MSLIVPNAGEKHFLNIAVGDGTTEDYVLKLYSNDYTPVATTDSTNFTEATFTGYSSKSLTRANFTDATTDVDGKASVSYNATQTWDATSAETIYGYYVVAATAGTCLWAERFDSSRDLVSGDSLSIVPKVTLKSEN